MKPVVAVAGLLSSFLCASVLLFLCSKLLPAVNDRYVLSYPSNLESLKVLVGLLQEYKEENTYSVGLVFCVAYLYKQTFAIPGSVFMNLMAGALFGLPKAFLITCTLTACGATLCYTLSNMFGKSILMHYFFGKVQSLEAKIHDNKDGLFFFLLCLRLFPMSPNWFLNMASPVLGIPVSYFFPTVLIGLMPYNFICCQTGCILAGVTSLNDILTPSIMLKMSLVAVVVALPGVIVKKWKKAKPN